MKFLENFKKYWFLYGIVVALIGAIGWIFSQGGISHEKETRLFSTPELRIEVEADHKQRPTPAQQMKLFVLDSIANVRSIENDSAAKVSRARRDSIYLEEVKARKITDSILLLNADQVYQIKEELKRIKQE